MGNPNWYCKEVEFRAVREDDAYEVGCDCCGYKTHIYARRRPADIYVEYVLEEGCTCE